MRIHRIYLPTLQAGEVTLVGSEAHHLARVLRVSVGQEVKAFDGKGLEATGIIKSVNDFQVVLHLQEPKASEVEASLKITLAIALLKGDKLADVVRQATELGVVAVQPLITKYCDVKELSAPKLERLRRVAQEASKQSGRSVVPEIREAIKLQSLKSPPNALLAHPYASSSLTALAPLVKGGRGDLAVVTGSEGGFAEEEIELLISKGVQPVRLGSRILRAETAPIALIAALLLPDAL
jgi:16S rRNA (uracil1498-N3)-methyltransferase